MLFISWLDSVDENVMKMDHCNNNIFHIMKFAFTFFVNRMPATLQHNMVIVGDHSCTAQFLIEISFLRFEFIFIKTFDEPQ